MKLSLVIVPAYIIWLMIFIGCVGSEKNSGLQSAGFHSVGASCNECHAFPGSERCRMDTVLLSSDGSHMQCYSCHLGAIRFDSSYVSAESSFLYFDATFLQGNKAFPVTDSLHGDGSITAIFAKCTYCHDYPPRIGRHVSHVTAKKKQCFECHFLSVMSDTDKSSGNQAPLFLQRSHPVPGGGSLPSMNSASHINRQIDVAFRKKYESFPTIDSIFRWNPLDNSCSNIQCHSGKENGGAAIERNVWKEITQ